MALDTNIPLSVQPSPAISPMQSIGQLMQLRDVSSQVALRQAQTQHFQQQAAQEQAITEQKTRDLQAVKNLQGLLADPASYTKIAQGDYAPIYQHGGITPGVADAFIKENDAKRTTAQTLKTGQAGLYAGQRAILQNGLEGVMSEKDDAISASQYQQMKAELSKEAPDIAQHLPDLSAGPTYRQQLTDLSNINGFHHALLQHAADEEAKKATALKETSQGNLAASEGLIKSRQLAGMDEKGLLPEEQVRSQQAAAALAATQQAHAETARHNIADESAARIRANIEVGRLNLEKQRAGFDMNGGISDTAKMIAAGNLDPQTVRAMLRKNPGLMGQVKVADPNFDEANIEKRYNTLKEFTSTSNGKAGGQAIALNTLIHHADLYQEVADSLKNGSFTPGNAVYNKVASIFGSAPPTNAALVGRFLAGETGKVATGGVPAEGEINGILHSLSTSASPDQIKQAGATLLQIASGRAIPLQERVKDARLDKVVHVLGPDAQNILTKRGYDPETMNPVRAATSNGGYQPGHLYGGMEYLGGDPKQQSSWRKH